MSKIIGYLSQRDFCENCGVQNRRGIAMPVFALPGRCMVCDALPNRQRNYDCYSGERLTPLSVVEKEVTLRDTKFAEYARLVWAEINEKGKFNIDMASKDSDAIVQSMLAQYFYDVAYHVIDHGNEVDLRAFTREEAIEDLPDLAPLSPLEVA